MGMTDNAITFIDPTAEPKMDVHLEVRCPLTHRWRLAAKFEYGIHAMQTAEALSKADTRAWRVVDNRWEEDPLTITYTKGEAR
jgi:hypothetical protein